MTRTLTPVSRRAFGAAVAVTSLAIFMSRAKSDAVPRPERILTEGEYREIHQPLAPFPDHDIGLPSAPVTMIAYINLACGTCGWFVLRVLPELRRTYIDPGKLRIVFRPILSGEDAFDTATVLTKCAPDHQRDLIIRDFFMDQERLREPSPEPAQRLYLTWRLAGLSADNYNTCLRSVAVDAAKRISDAARDRFGIKATPTFVINNKVYGVGESADGRISNIRDFRSVIETELAGANR